MPSRTQLGKDSAPSYDPQVGAAAQANAALSQKSEQFSEDYFNKYVAPLLQASAQETATNTANQNELYGINLNDLKLNDQRYRQNGIPAEDAYYSMVKNYSAPDYQEQQAGLAMGDAATAQGVQKQGLYRSLASAGIDPSSPGATSALADMAVSNAAASAGAATRARQSAQQLGMSLTSDAANFGRGGSSAVLNFGQAASGNSTSALGGLNGSVGTASSGSQNVMQGYGLGLSGYSQNLNAYSGLQKSSIQANAENSAGLGNFLGALGGAAITKWSDRRLKKNVQRLVSLSSGIGFYEFNYHWEPNGAPKHTGCMADEVEKVFPDAVATDPSGFKRVDYSKVTF